MSVSWFCKDLNGQRFLSVLMQKLRTATRQASLRLPAAYANRHLAVMSFEQKDYSTAQGLLDLSVWSDDSLEQPDKPFFSGKLAAAADSSIFKALLAVETRNKAKPRCGLSPSRLLCHHRCCCCVPWIQEAGPRGLLHQKLDEIRARR